MDFSFQPLSTEHISLLHKWMQEPHVSQWWEEGRSWSLNDIKEKYTSYTLGYKIQQGMKKPIHPFLKDHVFKHFDACLVDPEKNNKAAVKAYAKAGFSTLQDLDSSIIMIAHKAG